MKPILHFQLATDVNGNIVSKADMLRQFIKLVNDKVGNEYTVIASPYNPSMLGEDSKVFNFKLDEISMSELTKMFNE